MAELDLNGLLSSISPEDMEELKKTATRLLGSMSGGEEKPPKKEEKPQPQPGEKNNFGLPSDLGMPDLSQLAALAPVLQTLGSKDYRLDFINSLRPLLSEERQKKADEAAKLVRILSLLPLLRERGLL